MSILNTSNPTNFLLFLPDAGLTESIQMNIQVYKPPTIEIPGTNIPSGPFGKSRSHIPGTVFEYKPITMSILVDRDLNVWNDMYRWMLAIQNYKTMINKSFEETSQVSMYVHILDNMKDNTILIHEFVSPFPSLVYAPTFNHTASTQYPLIMNVEFKYHTFNVLDSQGNNVGERLTLQQAEKQNRDDILYNIKENPIKKPIK